MDERMIWDLPKIQEVHKLKMCIRDRYGDENDGAALAQIREMFPDREVVGVRTKEVVFGGGNIHCITQQQPK